MTHETDPASRSVLLPEGAAGARLILCERTGRWAAALRRELGGEGTGPFCLKDPKDAPHHVPLSPHPSRIEETRSLSQAFRVLAGGPASFLIVELSRANVDSLLEHMTDLPRRFPLARLAVVSDRRLSGYRWLVQEAGAVWYTSSPRRLASLAGLACRHLALAPKQRRGLREQIWASLPWGSGEEDLPVASTLQRAFAEHSTGD